MHIPLKNKILGSVVAVAVMASALVAVVPAFASGFVMGLSTASTNVANGATFTVNITANNIDPIRAFGTNVTFDPAKLQAVSVAQGTFLSNWASANGASVGVAMASTINNTTGTITDISYYLQGGTGGPSGSGVLATVTFQAAAAVNSTTAINLASALYTDLSINDQPATGLLPLTMTVGTVPQPDLTVSNVAATPVSGNMSNYNVTFTVNNIGNANSASSNASIVVDGGTPIIVAVGAINAGSSANLGPVGPVAITGTSDSIVVTADSGNVIVESNEANNSATGSYSYVPASGKTTDVNGSIVGTLTFTQPTAVEFGTLNLGSNLQTKSMNVLSNQSWAVAAHGNAPSAGGTGIDGLMTKWSPSAGYNSNVKLHQNLMLDTAGGYLGAPADPSMTAPANKSFSLTGVDQLLANGIPEGQNADGTSGESRTVNFRQTVIGSDAALAAPYSYHIVVSFTASTTAW